MTCSHCGANLIDETVCPYCRCRVEYPKQNSQDVPDSGNFSNFENSKSSQNSQNSQNYTSLFSGNPGSPQVPVKASPLPPAVPPVQQMHPDRMHYKKPAALMCALGFIGIGGLHRFYTGKIFTGLLYLFSFGLFGIGTLIDLILILMNYFHDRNGNQLQ